MLDGECGIWYSGEIGECHVGFEIRRRGVDCATGFAGGRSETQQGCWYWCNKMAVKVDHHRSRRRQRPRSASSLSFAAASRVRGLTHLFRSTNGYFMRGMVANMLVLPQELDRHSIKLERCTPGVEAI